MIFKQQKLQGVIKKFSRSLFCFIIVFFLVLSFAYAQSDFDFEKRAYVIADDFREFLDERVEDTLTVTKFNFDDSEMAKSQIESFFNKNKKEIWINLGSNDVPFDQRLELLLYKEIVFIDKDGNEIIKYNKQGFSSDLRDVSLPINTEFKSERYFEKASGMAAGSVHIGKVMTWYIFKEEVFNNLPSSQFNDYDKVPGLDTMKEGIIRFSAPVYDNQELKGVVVLSLDYLHLRELSKHMDPTSLQPVLSSSYLGNYMLIYDIDGTAIIHPKPDNIRGYLEDGGLAGFNEPNSTRKGTIFNFYKYEKSLAYRDIAKKTLEKKITYLASATDVRGRTKLTLSVPILYSNEKTNYVDTKVFGGIMSSIEFSEEGTEKLALTLEEKAWLEEHPIIKVSSEVDWPPFDFVENGVSAGISIDYIKLLGKKIGVDFQFVQGTWAEVFERFRNREIDVLHPAIATEERKQFTDFLPPHIQLSNVIVIRDIDRATKTLKDLNGRTVAVIKDWENHIFIERHYPGITLFMVKSPLDALIAVSQGKADAYLDNIFVVEYLIKKHLLGNLKILYEAELPEFELMPLHIGVRNDWPTLHTLLKKAMDYVTVQEIAQIYSKWGLSFREGAPGLQLTEEEKAWLEEHKDIRIGADPDWPPFDFFDGLEVHQGICHDYGYKIESLLNVNFIHPKKMPWAEMIEKAKQKKVDVIPCIVKTPKRSEYLLFTQAYLKLPVVLVTREDMPLIGDFSEMNGKKIAVIKGFASEEWLSDDFPEMIQVPVKNLEEALEAVSEGKVEGTIDTFAAIKYSTQKLGIKNLKISATTPYAIELSFGVRKDWPEMVEILEKAISTISDEDKKGIQDKWITALVEIKIDWSYVWRVALSIGAGAIVIIGFFIIWNRRLTKEIIMRKNAERGFKMAKIKAEKEAKKLTQMKTATLNILEDSEEARKELLRVQLGIERSDQAIFMTDKKGVISYVNPAFEKIYGYKASEVLGKTPRILKSGKLSMNYYKNLWKNLLNKKAIYTEMFNKTKDGRLINIKQSANPIIGQDGEIIGFMAIQSDITQQKTAEEKVALYMKGFDSSPNSMVLVEYKNKKPYIVHINKSFTRYYGYTEKEVIGENPSILKSGEKDKEYYRKMWKAITDPKVGYWQSEIKNRRKDGTFIDVLLTNNTIFDENGKPAYFMTHHTDITERKEIDRAKTEFVSLASHQLRTPLTGIKWLIQAVLKKGSLNKWQIDFLQDALKSNDRMVMLVSDLLNISRLEAGVVGVAPQKTDITNFIDEIIKEVKVDVSLKQQKIQFKKPKQKIAIALDRELIGQVITNLFSNASKYSNNKTTIIVSMKKLKDEVEISVRDQGIGLSKDDQGKLFDKFFRSDQASRMDTKGSGLGLYIVKKILDAHGGKIKVSSKSGKGSTFTITLPLKGPSHKKGAKELITHKMS